MNRILGGIMVNRESVPRKRGDEPAVGNVAEVFLGRSPQTRG